MDVLVGTLSFRVQELNVRVESKTLDNVFLTATVSVQYCILAEKGTFVVHFLPNKQRTRFEQKNGNLKLRYRNSLLVFGFCLLSFPSHSY